LTCGVDLNIIWSN